jgi:hypothetical protein
LFGVCGSIVGGIVIIINLGGDMMAEEHSNIVMLWSLLIYLLINTIIANWYSKTSKSRFDISLVYLLIPPITLFSIAWVSSIL